MIGQKKDITVFKEKLFDLNKDSKICIGLNDVDLDYGIYFQTPNHIVWDFCLLKKYKILFKYLFEIEKHGEV